MNNRKTSQTGIDLIKRFEGFVPTPYVCEGGKLTVGYGHVILPHEKDRLKHVTKEQAEAILRDDVVIAEDAVNRLVTVPITQGTFDALVSFTFNLGAGALQRSTLLELLNQKNYAAADKQLPRWVFAGGKKLRGLERRRAAEQELFQDAAVELEPVEEVAQDMPTIQKPIAASRTVKASAMQVATGGVIASGGIAQGVDMPAISDTVQQAVQIATAGATLSGLFREHWAELLIMLGLVVIGAGLWAGYARINDYMKVKHA